MASNYNVEYGSETELANIELFRGYPESLLQFASACYVIFILIGVPGNLITIIALGRCRKFRNATAIFIISLHVNNLIFCCMILPMTSINYIMRHWIFGGTMCNIHAIMKYTLVVTARFTVVAITVNRYILVCHPLMYPRLYKRIPLIVSLLSTWVASFILFLPPFFGVWGKFGIDPKGIACKLIPDANNISPTQFLTCFAFVGPYLIISVCYGCIWWTVRNKMKQCRNHKICALSPTKSTKAATGDLSQDISVCTSSTNDENYEHTSSIILTPDGTKTLTKKLNFPTRKDKKLARMILAILISFAICHLPLMMTRAVYGEYISNPTVHVLVYLLECCTVFINPILYVIMSNEYRQAYKSLFENMKPKRTEWFKS